MLALARTAGVFRRLLEKLFEVRRVPPGRPVLQDWLEVALWTAIFVAATLTSPVKQDGSANAPGDGWLQQHTGGGICVFRRVTGIECPGCGLSRGFVQLAHGHAVEAVKLNPLTPILFFLIGARLLHCLVFCFGRVDVSNKIPWPIAWKFYEALIAGFALLGVYRVALRFI